MTSDERERTYYTREDTPAIAAGPTYSGSRKSQGGSLPSGTLHMTTGGPITTNGENPRRRMLSASEKLALIETTLERALNREAKPSELCGAKALVQEIAGELVRLAEEFNSD